MIGSLLNAYAISKFKKFLNGKYFWLRSLAASTIGEFVFVIICYVIEFWGMVSFSKLCHLILVGYLVKLLVNPILVIPTTILVYLLKKFEGIDLYNNSVAFNPIKINSL